MCTCAGEGRGGHLPALPSRYRWIRSRGRPRLGIPIPTNGVLL